MERRGWQDSEDEGAPRAQVQFGLPRLTPAVKALMLVNVGLFLVSFLVYFFGRVAEQGDLWGRVFGHLFLDPQDWRAFFAGLPVWQVVTYGFLHGVTDLGHIIGNMLMLYFFGTMLEGLVGTRRFLLTYFAAMVVGAVVFLVPALVFGGVFDRPALGASGACLGVMIAMAMLRPMSRVIVFVFPMTLRTLALILIAFDVFGLLVTIAERASDGTAHLVHLGGVLYAFVAVKSGLISLDPVEYIERRRAVKEVEQAASDEVRMDQLLEKIHREGMSSLSKGEKDFLKRVSAKR
ncbi:MAG: rhomboid family intramembrane serine protease [Planctomycetes bacterium]|nr:rhomboid family intramembrane serine protease [Planctomycetota bacterium]